MGKAVRAVDLDDRDIIRKSYLLRNNEEQCRTRKSERLLFENLEGEFMDTRQSYVSDRVGILMSLQTVIRGKSAPFTNVRASQSATL